MTKYTIKLERNIEKIMDTPTITVSINFIYKYYYKIIKIYDLSSYRIGIVLNDSQKRVMADLVHMSQTVADQKNSVGLQHTSRILTGRQCTHWMEWGIQE